MIFIIFIAIIVLWYLGGQAKGWIRDVLVPILIGLGVYFALKEYWLIMRIFYGIITCGTFQIIRLGYGNFEGK